MAKRRTVHFCSVVGQLELIIVSNRRGDGLTIFASCLEAPLLEVLDGHAIEAVATFLDELDVGDSALLVDGQQRHDARLNASALCLGRILALGSCVLLDDLGVFRRTVALWRSADGC